MIETTPCQLWKPEHLVACLQSCLVCLLSWVIDGCCPNYFIPEENMFDGRISRQIRTLLKSVLFRVISSDCQFLPYIVCDDIGQHLKRFCLSEGESKVDIYSGVRRRTNIYISQLRQLTVTRNDILNKANSENIAMTVDVLFSVVSKLKRIATVTGHTNEQTDMAVSLLLPYIETYLMAAIIAWQVKLLGRESLAFYNYILSDNWNKISQVSNSLTARLKQATFLYTSGNVFLSLKVLHSLDKSLKHWTVTHCCCRDLSHRCELDSELLRKVVDDDITLNRFLVDCFAPCIVFLPSEKQLLPDALHFEMNRSKGMPPESRKRWYDWATVDSKVMLYFLLYLNHKELEMFSQAICTRRC